MRYLRSSIYLNPFEPPVTTVMAEDGLRTDLADTLESARAKLLTPGALMVFDIFESDGDIQQATLEAMERQVANAEQEAHQAMLYYWTLFRWGLVRKGGVLMMDKPAPLSREEICVVFEQLAQHPEYRDITIISHDREGVEVRMVNGKIKEDE